MQAKAAQSLCDEYTLIFEEKDVENPINQEKFFLNSLEVVHRPPYNETSYEVIVYAIKEGKVIEFKLQDAIRLFGKGDKKSGK
ncbi:MAG: hypothetical protein K0Q95_127 [Bacteroidota bacterium]|jgi:hypothetical protein|nr:hypothetical protein [Bacteroidota bacterium]